MKAECVRLAVAGYDRHAVGREADGQQVLRVSREQLGMRLVHALPDLQQSTTGAQHQAQGPLVAQAGLVEQGRAEGEVGHGHPLQTEHWCDMHEGPFKCYVMLFLEIWHPPTPS